MAKVQIKYEKLPYQEQFHSSTKEYVYLSAGYGAGKTYSLVMKAFQLMTENKGLPGGLLCPNLKMFKRDVLPTFKEICTRFNIQFKFNKQDYIFTFPTLNNSQIYVFHAEDDGYSIKGPNLAFMLINEVTLCSKEAFDTAISRVRIKKAKLLQTAMSGTPEGFNWVYEDFIVNPKPNVDLIFGDMRLNKHVSEMYAKRLEDAYDDVLVQQYIEGKFVNANTSAAIYKFNRQKHVKENIFINPDQEIFVSIDFNVAPMAATIWNRVVGGPVKIRAFDEICIKDNADTETLAQVIKEKVGTNVVLFPDPAGKSRSTRSNRSDIQILRDAGFQDIRFKSKIMSVRDCLNATNAMFNKGEIEIGVQCKHTIMDLEQCVMKPGTNEIDKSDLNRTHWLDGLKNMIDYEFPILAKSAGWKEVRLR